MRSVGRCFRARAAALLGLAICLWASAAVAEGASTPATRRLLLLLGPNQPRYYPRLRAELGASGFSPVELSSETSPPSAGEIERLAQRERVFVGLAPLESGGGFVLWLVDPASGRLRFRQLLLGLYAPDDPPDVVAVRVVEALRATLIELQTPPAEAPAPRARLTQSPRAPASSSCLLGVGVRGAYSPGGVGAIALVDLSLAWLMTPRLALALDAALTPAPTRLRGAEGSASLDWYLAGAALSFSVTNPAAPLGLRSGAGMWLAYMVSRGEALAPFENRSTSSLSAIPHVDLGLRWKLTPRLGLSGDAAVGLSAPGSAIHFANRQVATWGRPLWLGRVSFEVALD